MQRSTTTKTTTPQHNTSHHKDPNALVKGVPGHHLPVVKHALAVSLALCVIPQVSLKAKGLDDRQAGPDDKGGRAGLGLVRGYVAAALGEDVVDGGNAICGKSGLDIKQSCVINIGAQVDDSTNMHSAALMSLLSSFHTSSEIARLGLIYPCQHHHLQAFGSPQSTQAP